jgi:hypothetical protein
MDFNSFALPTSFFAWSTPITTSYILIIAAEIGDKSQLVCMTLAARYRATPVIFGAIVEEVGKAKELKSIKISYKNKF